MRNRHPDRTRLELIATELDLAETFLRIVRTSPNAETRRRNRVYAQEAYAMAGRYWSGLVTSAELNQAIEEKFSELKGDLEAAGVAV